VLLAGGLHGGQLALIKFWLIDVPPVESRALHRETSSHWWRYNPEPFLGRVIDHSMNEFWPQERLATHQRQHNGTHCRTASQ
jgi:hypothetical protein